MRTQLALPLNGVLSQETYNQFFTMHGTMMMFPFAVPAVEALGVLLLPQMLAARDLPFPRLSAYAFWAYLVGGLAFRSEEHTSELQSLMRISYAVFGFKKQ